MPQRFIGPQKPTTLFIGCSDSRLVPSQLTDASPGKLFMVRNVGNFVPPYEDAENLGYHGVSSAIEFATIVLGVKAIVVCGHSDCGAIAALYNPPNQSTPHVNKWLELGRDAMFEGEPDRELLRRTEQRSIALQLERLMTFPIVRARVEQGELSLHGWYYVLDEGRVYIRDPQDGEFRAVAT
ncbi:MAG: carbonic anhydrase [Gemmatimonadota bacterium]